VKPFACRYSRCLVPEAADLIRILHAQHQIIRRLLLCVSTAVNKYLPRPKVAQGVNLLSGKNDAGEQRTQAEQAAAAAAPREIINFLKPNISIAIVDDRSEYAIGQLVPQASRSAALTCPPDEHRLVCLRFSVCSRLFYDCTCASRALVCMRAM